MSRLGGWVRWIGCAAVWEAGRAVCGEAALVPGRSAAARRALTRGGAFNKGEFCTQPPSPHPPQVGRAKARPLLRHYGPGGSTMGSPRSGFGTAARGGRSRPILPR